MFTNKNERNNEGSTWRKSTVHFLEFSVFRWRKNQVQQDHDHVVLLFNYFYVADVWLCQKTFSWFSGRSVTYIPVYKYVLSTMGVSKESNSKF